MRLPNKFIIPACLGFALAASAPAMEIAGDYTVKFTPENAILGHFSATKKPVLTVKSGAIVRIEVGGGARWGEGDPNAWLKENGEPTTVEPVQATKVLHVACGTAYGSAILAKLGASVVALDEDRKLVDLGAAALASIGISSVKTLVGPLAEGAAAQLARSLTTTAPPVSAR